MKDIDYKNYDDLFPNKKITPVGKVKQYCRSVYEYNYQYCNTNNYSLTWCLDTMIGFKL